MIDTRTRKLSFKESETWIMADPHFDHAGIIGHCERPFSSVEEMNAAIWGNLRVVGPDDTLIILGDLGWKGSTENLIARLPGKHRILVCGNHESEEMASSKHWTRSCDYLEARFIFDNKPKKSVVLCHYPMVSWNGARTSIHLHGHTHGCIAPLATEFGGRMDCGVDVWDFKPVRLRDVISKLDTIREDGFAKPGEY